MVSFGIEYRRYNSGNRIQHYSIIFTMLLFRILYVGVQVYVYKYMIGQPHIMSTVECGTV